MGQPLPPNDHARAKRTVTFHQASRGAVWLLGGDADGLTLELWRKIHAHVAFQAAYWNDERMLSSSFAKRLVIAEGTPSPSYHRLALTSYKGKRQQS